ncbi:MAG: PrsW family intramembrane metalloprotease [Patescibacteria group bacterium]|nr:PrsW family intramembrane metalloprotease [Patescibacteria group bacterium]
MEITVKLFFVLFIALLPSLFWLRVFLKEDYREPEPKKLIATFLTLGIVAALASLVVEIIISDIFLGDIVIRIDEYSFDEIWTGGNILKIVFVNFFVPPIVEEFFKCSMVKKVGMKSLHFNQIIDGMIYAIAVALGFAFMENFVYFMEYIQEGADALAGVFIIRFLASTLLHALATGTFGYYIAKSKFLPPQLAKNGFLSSKQKYILKGFVLAVVIHFVFNFLLIFGFAQYSILILLFIGLSFFEKMRSSESQSYWYSEKKGEDL